jgi:hypothetical protein
VEYLQPVIQAAADRRVKVVLQTAIGVDADEKIPYRQVELFLIRTGIPFVILRPNESSSHPDHQPSFEPMIRHLPR